MSVQSIAVVFDAEEFAEDASGSDTEGDPFYAPPFDEYGWWEDAESESE